jgi:hypothetical protein
MTPEETAEWNKFACVPRSLIRIAELNNQPLTSDEFYERFKGEFRHPDKFGLLEEDQIPGVAKTMLLSGGTITTNDYETVMKAFDERKNVLIISHVDLNPGHANELHHCSVLSNMNCSEFTLWTASQNGGSGELPPYKRDDWAAKQCSGIILEPTRKVASKAA